MTNFHGCSKVAACKPTNWYKRTKGALVHHGYDKVSQGIMEKSQRDLKMIRFQWRQLTRLNDFVYTYKTTVTMTLRRDYSDSLKGKEKKKVNILNLTWHVITIKCNRYILLIFSGTQINIAQNNADIQDEAVKGVSTSSQDHAPSLHESLTRTVMCTLVKQQTIVAFSS